MVSSDRTGGNGRKLKQKRLTLNIRKLLFIDGVTKHWHGLPRVVEVIRSHLDMVITPWL